jgi:hypothetical protein
VNTPILAFIGRTSAWQCWQHLPFGIYDLQLPIADFANCGRVKRGFTFDFARLAIVASHHPYVMDYLPSSGGATQF